MFNDYFVNFKVPDKFQKILHCFIEKCGEELMKEDLKEKEENKEEEEEK